MAKKLDISEPVSLKKQKSNSDLLKKSSSQLSKVKSSI